MSEPKLSNRARKKLQRQGESPAGARSESGASDVPKKDDVIATLDIPAGDSVFKPREGPSPYIDVVQKKIRNLTKRRARLENLDAQKRDPSAPALKPDQVEALSFLPQVIAIITELNELIATFKKLEQSETEYLVSQHRKYKEDLHDAERRKESAVKEAYTQGLTDGRSETKVVTSFLKYASYLRGSPSDVEGENQAAEDVLIGVYEGGDKGAIVAQKLAEGVNEAVGGNEQFTYGRVKESVLRYENPPAPEAEETTEQTNGTSHEEQSAEPTTNGAGGYQVPLAEASPLGNGSFAEEARTQSTSLGGLNFLQTSELENESYPTSSQGGVQTQGISFLQESELGTSQPHEPNADPNDQVEDVSRSSQLPPVQTLTENQGPPKVNLGISTYNGAKTGEAGNAAAESILSQTEGKPEKKTDWAEEMSPTTETAPALPEKKKEEEEWTTQGSRHGRHQSQHRGGRGQGRGRAEGGRGGGRGGYRGGRGGERGASNGEKRGSWRGGERGRGRGGNNSLPSTAA